MLADRLRDRILSGQWLPGRSLPTERELVEESALSRASVREALRILEVEGLIETRRGRNGGSRVRRPSDEQIIRSLALYIQGARVNFRSLLEVREAIEPAAAALAAERRSAADLKRLIELNALLPEAAGDSARFLAVNLDWHMTIVRASRNEFFTAFMTALSEAIREATAIDAFDNSGIRKATVRAHQKVIEAIEAGDADAARKSMAAHVEAATEVSLQNPVRDLRSAEGADGRKAVREPRSA